MVRVIRSRCHYAYPKAPGRRKPSRLPHGIDPGHRDAVTLIAVTRHEPTCTRVRASMRGAHRTGHPWPVTMARPGTHP